jgi:hypothetical protein
MNVHKGEGMDGHANCRAEALLQPGGCPRHNHRHNHPGRTTSTLLNTTQNGAIIKNPNTTIVSSSSSTLTNTVGNGSSSIKSNPSSESTNTSTVADAADASSSSVSFQEAIQQVRQLARERPNFFRDVKA